MPQQGRTVYLRLRNKESAELQEFLASRRDSEDAHFMLQELREVDAAYRKLGITICFPVELGKAIELEKMLKEKVPTAEGGWTSLHYIRMDLMVAIGEHKRRIEEKACRSWAEERMRRMEFEREETVQEAEMRGLATLGIGPMWDLARSAIADFRFAFGCPRKTTHVEGRRTGKGKRK